MFTVLWLLLDRACCVRLVSGRPVEVLAVEAVLSSCDVAQPQSQVEEQLLVEARSRYWLMLKHKLRSLGATQPQGDDLQDKARLVLVFPRQSRDTCK